MNSVFGFDIVTIVFLALAVFVFVKLRSVLGTRTGSERPPYDPYAPREAPKPVPAEKPVTIQNRNNEEAPVLRDAEREVPAGERWAGVAPAGSAIAAGLEAIANADRGFDARHFLDGAKGAYEIIVTAFAEGDRKTLRAMLGKDLFEEFAAALNDREAKGLKMESRFVSIDKAEIKNAVLDGREARVTIDFVSQLVSAVRDKDGTVVDGSAEALTEVEDLWVFARDVSSSDPNWKLVENNEAA